MPCRAHISRRQLAQAEDRPQRHRRGDGQHARLPGQGHRARGGDLSAAALDGAEEHALLTAIATTGKRRDELAGEWEDEAKPEVDGSVDALQRAYTGNASQLRKVESLSDDWERFKSAYQGGQLSAEGGDYTAAADTIDEVMDPAKTDTDELAAVASKAAKGRFAAEAKATSAGSHGRWCWPA